MSSAVVSTPAALGRPFVFDDADAEVCPSSAAGKKPALQESAITRVIQSAINNQKSAILSAVTPASQLEIRPAPEMVSSGVPAIDTLTSGLPRGCLTEICGPASSGRTTILLAALAAATRRGEFCVVVDASDALDPQSATAAGVDLDRLLWVRCGDDIQPSSCLTGTTSLTKNLKSAGAPPLSRTLRQGGEFDFRSQDPLPLDFQRSEVAGSRPRGEGNELQGNSSSSMRQSDHRLEQVLRATDLLLESGGFGLIVLDLGDLPPQSARRIPLTTWFRYRRAIEHTPTILLTIEQQAIAGSCSSLLLKLGAPNEHAAERRKKTNPHAQNEIDFLYPLSHAQLLTGLEITAELIRSRLDRKPARPVAFATKTAWDWMNMTG